MLLEKVSLNRHDLSSEYRKIVFASGFFFSLAFVSFLELMITAGIYHRSSSQSWELCGAGFGSSVEV